MRLTSSLLGFKLTIFDLNLLLKTFPPFPFPGVTVMFDSGVILLGEIRWYSLLGIKGLGGFGKKKKTSH